MHVKTQKIIFMKAIKEFKVFIEDYKNCFSKVHSSGIILMGCQNESGARFCYQ